MFKIIIIVVEEGYRSNPIQMSENDLRRFIRMNPDSNWEYDHT